MDREELSVEEQARDFLKRKDDLDWWNWKILDEIRPYLVWRSFRDFEQAVFYKVYKTEVKGGSK